jgi:hypothetical protein
MTPRNVIRGLLLAFVVVSAAYLAAKSIRAANEWRPPQIVQAADPATATPQQRGPNKVIAYYFHVSARCVTCRNIENYSKEVIHQRFAEELGAGTLEWRLVNVQLPENRHYIQDYELFTKSLVVVLMKDGREREHKVLNDTWELVGNKAEMQKYVEREVRGYLRKL